jgi:hypothetical protein
MPKSNKMDAKIDFSQIITSENKAKAAQDAENEAKRTAAKVYLAETDWFVARFAETGKAIPEDILAKRADARKAINEVKE